MTEGALGSPTFINALWLLTGGFLLGLGFATGWAVVQFVIALVMIK